MLAICAEPLGELPGVGEGVPTLPTMNWRRCASDGDDVGGCGGGGVHQLPFLMKRCNCDADDIVDKGTMQVEKNPQESSWMDGWDMSDQIALWVYP